MKISEEKAGRDRARCGRKPTYKSIKQQRQRRRQRKTDSSQEAASVRIERR